jgi:hypothetical protein
MRGEMAAEGPAAGTSGNVDPFSSSMLLVGPQPKTCLFSTACRLGW